MPTGQGGSVAGHGSQYYSSPPHCTSSFSKKVSKIVQKIGFLIPLNGKKRRGLCIDSEKLIRP
jgi:hypothetical protein